jgi:LacI family transcriptional regulator
MGVTIYDLAREAGVGIGTVSRCLNNHPSVSPGTREKVLATAKRLNYQPLAHARRLASSKTDTISTIIPFFTNYFFREVLQGVQDKAAELGFDVILHGVNVPAQVEHHLHRLLHSGHVDAMMFCSMKFPESFVAKLRQMNLPVVMVDTRHEQFDSLSVRNKEGGMRATQHLISLGHENIAMINATLESEPARERLEGYRAGIEHAGLTFVAGNVLTAAIDKHDGFNREAGYASMKELLKRSSSLRNRVSAVFVSSDVQAMGALQAARELGVRIPEDIAMVSFDDIELASHAQLSTMRQPMHELGGLAVEKLRARMKDPSLPPSLTTFLPELIIRQTCGARESSGIQPLSRPTIELENPPS